MKLRPGIGSPDEPDMQFLLEPNGFKFRMSSGLMKGRSMSVVLVTTYLSISYLSAVGIDAGSLPADHSIAVFSTSSSWVGEQDSNRTSQVDGFRAVLDTAVKPRSEWMTSFDAASKVAIRNKLPLLLHFEAPWCGACRQMESTVLNTSSVKSKLGSQVIGVRLNADQNKHLIAKFGISTLPSEVVILGDGSQGDTYVGAASLGSYVARLDHISGQNTEVFENDASESDASKTNPNLRSCLIVTRNGEMVGLGGFSPVSLHNDRSWKKGNQAYIATYDGVDYYLTSPEQLSEFQSSPETYIPKFHGCDLVTLRHEHEAKTGAIEFGTFYEGAMYFFASTDNRNRFQKNPAWYLEGASAANLLTPEMLADDELRNN